MKKKQSHLQSASDGYKMHSAATAALINGRWMVNKMDKWMSYSQAEYLYAFENL